MSVPDTQQAFEQALAALRPKLHRYCARMAGSVIDGEDIVQEALIKAMEAFSQAEPIAHVEGWLFRIAHNAALDLLRRRARQATADEDLDMIADPQDQTERRQIARASLRTFMRLPVAQRSCVILMDVLGYSLEEIGEVIGSSIASVKAALHRGRARLRELAQETEELPAPVLAEAERLLLAAYVDRFNARDFDAIRNMLADEVRLDLVSRRRASGRSQVGTYFHNYSLTQDWHLSAGLVDGHPAVLVCDPANPAGPPTYFMLLGWTDGRVGTIRDFRYARYVTDGAEVRPLD
jgi:RNA polymerase sigma-70 factor, ECF subfamily